MDSTEKYLSTLGLKNANATLLSTAGAFNTARFLLSRSLADLALIRCDEDPDLKNVVEALDGLAKAAAQSQATVMALREPVARALAKLSVEEKCLQREINKAESVHEHTDAGRSS